MAQTHRPTPRRGWPLVGIVVAIALIAVILYFVFSGNGGGSGMGGGYAAIAFSARRLDAFRRRREAVHR